MQLKTYGETAEKRPLIAAIISAPENIAKLEQLKKSHQDLTKDENIAIVWMSYNVHGNESAGTEAALLTAYELLTSKQAWLKNTVVILDPCINPDGRDRYVNWYYQMLGKNPNEARNSREHDEPWPSGRPNHYLFDLNRDWAWNTQIETQQRLKLYNEWLPHVHVDFHEQGINDPYYFAPAAEPYHEVISNWQRGFQNGLGKNHARYFDEQGWLYFTKEIFDLLYPSYGDTYPTYCGAVGMTYEQGGSGRAGLAVTGENGKQVTLRDRLLHHHTTGLSTVEYSHLQAGKLIGEFREYVTNKTFKYKSFVLEGHPEKIRDLTHLLDAHEIRYSFAKDGQTKGYDYLQQKEESWKLNPKHLIVNTAQKKGALVNVLFEPHTYLSDSLTYDITAWSLPYAYGLNALATEQPIEGQRKSTSTVENVLSPNAYAYLIPWNSVNSARLLVQLQQKNLLVREAELPFKQNGIQYERGTLLVLRSDNPFGYDSTLVRLANELGIELTGTMTGMVDQGADFGSSYVKLIPKQRIMLISGEATSSLNVGEVWHFMDYGLNCPIDVVDEAVFSVGDLEGYTALIVPEGDFSQWKNNGTIADISDWVRNGGKLIVMGAALSFFNDSNGFELTAKPPADAEESEDKEKKEEKHEHPRIAYEKQEREAISSTITGAILECKLDATHPLAFGYMNTYATLKLSADSYKWLENGNNVCYLDKQPKVLGGFIGHKVKNQLDESLIFGTQNMGSGIVIYMVDNPLFRGFWQNGKLFFANALFMTNN